MRFHIRSLDNMRFNIRNLDKKQLAPQEPVTTSSFQEAACSSSLSTKALDSTNFEDDSLTTRDLQTGNFSASSLAEESFTQATSETAAWKTRPSAQQLQRQQLGRHFALAASKKAASKRAAWKTAASKTAAWKTAAWKTAASKTAAWNRAASQTAAWKKRPSPTAASKQQLPREQLESSFQEDSLADKSFQRTASTTELSELQRTALHTELAQLERNSFRHTALTQAASSLALESPASSFELSPAQLCSQSTELQL